MANKKISQIVAGGVVAPSSLIEIETAAGVSGFCTLLAAVNQIVSPTADTPPATANAMDDEFASAATLPGGATPLWTWDNQAGATATIVSGVVQLRAPATALNVNAHRALYQTLPSAPWEFTCKVYGSFKWAENYFSTGLALIESSTGKRTIFTIGYDGGNKLQIWNWTNNSTLSLVNVADVVGPRIFYLRISRVVTTINYYFSEDGISFFLLFTESATAYMAGGANRIALLANVANGAYSAIGSFHWFRRTV